MSNTLVWITFPTVDIINPEEDEIIDRLASELDSRGIKGEFIFSGVKVQSTLQNRPQTIETLLRTGMAIGYQGNAHSLHPGLMEYEERCEWEDGLIEAAHRETKWLRLDGSVDPERRGGILLLQDTFGNQFAGFRGAGGWTAQLMDALRQHGITVHHTLFDMAEALGQTAAFYLGCLQISPGRSRWTGQFPYASPLTNRLECELLVCHPELGIDRFAQSFDRMVDNYPFQGPRILFVNFHPFFLFTDTVADLLNYSNGRTPRPPSAIVCSLLLSPAEQERRWQTVRQIFDWLSHRSDISFVTSLDFLEQSKAIRTELNREEILSLAEAVAHLPLMRPPSHIRLHQKVFSLAEAFDLLQQAAIHSIQTGTLPDLQQSNFRLGPCETPSSRADRVAAPTVREVLEAATKIGSGAIPTEVQLLDGPVAPYPFLVGLGRAVLNGQEPQRTILIRPVDYLYPEMAESFNLSLKRNADWEIYHRHLDVSRIEKHASLQLWTFKPLE